MEFESLGDFYIDLDGDVKIGVTGKNEAKFCGNTDKFDSIYLTANSPQDILDIVSGINDKTHVPINRLFKVYSLKNRNSDSQSGVKIYIDADFEKEGLHYIMAAHEIYYDHILYEEYFLPSEENLELVLESKGLNYKIKKFNTHKILLHSFKYDSNVELIDFKTYYCNIDNPISYDNNFIRNIKKISSF